MPTMLFLGIVASIVINMWKTHWSVCAGIAETVDFTGFYGSCEVVHIRDRVYMWKTMWKTMRRMFIHRGA